MISMGKAKKWYKGTNLTWFLRLCSLMAFLSLCEVGTRKTLDSGGLLPNPLLCQFVLEDRPVVHHKLYVLQFAHVLQRIPRDGNDFGVCPGSNRPDLPFPIQHLRRPRGRRLNRVHRRHAHLHHPLELLRNRLGPRNAAHVRPKDNLQARFQRSEERRVGKECRARSSSWSDNKNKPTG